MSQRKCKEYYKIHCWVTYVNCGYFHNFNHMTRRLKTVLSVFLFTLTHSAEAQRFGGNPPAVKWRQFDTDTVRVIYPPGLEKEASRVVDITHYLSRTTTGTLGTDQKKIDIVLQNLPLISNAYVGLGPWRSEFYMTPLQNSLRLGSLPWVDKLSIHEYRHVQQFMNFRKGLSKFAWIIAGQEGQALANSAAVPDWFFEGDAVFQETLVSQQGRGRLPSFYNGYRSLWEGGRNYGYMKLRNGSLRDYVPDHYQLGYLLVSYGRQLYGPDFWRKVTSDAVRFKPLVYPFQGAFKRHADTGFAEFAKLAVASLRQDSSGARDVDGGQWLTRTDKRFVKDYHMPRVIGPDKILALKSTYRDVPAWYVITPQGERKVAIRDIGLEDYYGISRGVIAYVDYRPHPRWSWMEYGGITLLDLYSGRRRRIARGTRYASPSISHNGQQVAAVHLEPGGDSYLHLLDAGSGQRERVLENPKRLFITHPVFSQDDKEIIAAVRNPNGEMALAAFRIPDGAMRIMVPFSRRPIGFPQVRDHRVIFTAAHEGRDRLFIWNDSTGELSMPPAHLTGSYEGDIDRERNAAVYSRFTADGYRIYRQEIRDTSLLDPAEWNTQPFQEITKEKEFDSSFVSIGDAPTLHTPSAHYPGSKGLFNFHSWRPWYEQPDWKFSVYGQNVLNTFRSELYYQYNQNEGYHKTGFNGTYAGWYPWLTAGLSYTMDRYFATTTSTGSPAQVYRWNEWNSQVGIQLPLNFSGGRHFRFLTLSGSFNNQQLKYKQTNTLKPDDRSFNYLQGGANWVMQSQQAPQHIFPRYAHTVSVQHRQAIGKTTAWQTLATGSVYLPGFLKTHNVVLNGAYQARDTLRQYLFTNNFALARGYPGLNYPRMWKWGVNYHFTIAYPDAGLAQLVYLLRLRAAVFFDASYVKSLRMQTVTPFRSLGAELYFDTKWWNQQPVSFGIRYSRLLDAAKLPQSTNANQWEFIVPINLFTN